MEFVPLLRGGAFVALRRDLLSLSAAGLIKRSASLSAAARGRTGEGDAHETVPDSAAHNIGANKTGKTKILYDGDCPLCIQEMKLVRYLNRKKDALHFVDISKPGYDRAEHNNIPLEEAMGVMHVVGPDNTVHKRVDAIHAMYSAVGWGWTAGFMKWPLFSGYVDRGYMWFARNRLRLTRRQCEEGNCKIPER